MRHADALAHLDAQRRRARQTLSLERGLAAAAPSIGFVGLWAALAMAGGFEALGALPEALAASAFWVALCGLCAWGWWGYRAPTDKEAQARLAADSGLEAAAVTALEDKPTRLDPVALALWASAQTHAREQARRLKAGPLRLNLAQIDPYWLRVALPVLLVVALAISGGGASDRLARALAPDPGVLAGDRPMVIEAWATPADYTGAAAVSLGDRMGQAVPTPPSVEVTVRVTGPKAAPDLVFIADGQQRRTVAFTLAGDAAFEARMAIPKAGELSVVRFHTKARWRILPAPDAPPTIAFDKPPPSAPTKRIGFSWTARDDFGVERVVLRMRPLAPPPGLVGAAPVDTPLESPGGAPKEAQFQADLLLYEHPYAGMEVEARLVAIDALGQEGESPPERMRLPEKRFSQSIALAAVEIRKIILHERRRYAAGPVIPDLSLARAVDDAGPPRSDGEPALLRAPQAIRRAARLLDAVTMEPDEVTFSNSGAWAGLRLARHTLARAQNIDETNQAASVLWQVALHAEHGDGADAERALQAARDALAQALRDGASEEERAQLMDELREAMNAYIEALAQRAMAEGQTPQNMDDTVSQNMLSSQDLERMMAEMKRMADAGDLNAAERLLQQLSQLLGNLSVQLGEGPGLQQSETRGSQAGPDQTAKGLSDAIGQQRALRDETARNGQPSQSPPAQDGEGKMPGGAGQGQAGGQAGQGGEAGEGGSSLAQRQGALADQIARQREGLGQRDAQAGAPLDAAEGAMREAEGALRSGDLARAEAAQEEALRKLRQGVEKLGSQQQRSAGASGQSGGPRDPLGRTIGGAGDGEETAVPEEVERQRAREILDDLRARAQDPRRPETERQYLRRLLERFEGS
jgi:hypothetical protein